MQLPPQCREKYLQHCVQRLHRRVLALIRYVESQMYALSLLFFLMALCISCDTKYFWLLSHIFKSFNNAYVFFSVVDNFLLLLDSHDTFHSPLPLPSLDNSFFKFISTSETPFILLLTLIFEFSQESWGRRGEGREVHGCCGQAADARRPRLELRGWLHGHIEHCGEAIAWHLCASRKSRYLPRSCVWFLPELRWAIIRWLHAWLLGKHLHARVENSPSCASLLIVQTLSNVIICKNEYLGFFVFRGV